MIRYLRLIGRKVSDRVWAQRWVRDTVVWKARGLFKVCMDRYYYSIMQEIKILSGANRQMMFEMQTTRDEIRAMLNEIREFERRK